MRRRPTTITGMLLTLGRIYLARFNRRTFVRYCVGALMLAIVWVVWSAASSRCALHGGRGAARAWWEGADAGASVNLAVAPSIAWTGSGYGVAWIDLRDRRTEVYFARLDRDGHRVGADVRVTDTAAVKALPHIAWNGREFAIVWTDISGNDAEVRLVRVDLQGRTIGAPISVSTEPGRDFGARAAWNGQHFGVAWLHVASRSEFGLRFVRVDRDGVRLGRPLDLVEHSVLTGSPDVAATADGFAVAFNEFRLRAGATTTLVVRIDAEGHAGSPTTLSTRAGIAAQVSSSATGSIVAAVWRDDIGVNHSTVAFGLLDGDVTTTPRAPLTDGRRYAGNPALTVGSDGFGVAFEASPQTRTGVFFSTVSARGVPAAEPTRVTTHDALAQSPHVAWNGGGYALVWCDHRSGGPAIYYTQLDRNGRRTTEDSRVSGP